MSAYEEYQLQLNRRTAISQFNEFVPKHLREPVIWTGAQAAVVQGCLDHFSQADRPTGVLLMGPTGRGKTSIAVGLGYWNCTKGRKSLFIDPDEVDQQLRKSYRKVERAISEDMWRSMISESDLIILEDIGRLEAPHVQRLHRMAIAQVENEGKLAIITTNLNIEGLDEALGSDTRMLSRMAGWPRFVVAGDDMRRKR